MGTVGTILIALLVFGFLILIHELGHYITARIFKVSITEFSIGMGPKLAWYDSKKTGIRYSLSMFPLGGYVAMVGEDAESDDPNAFNKKPAWQRFIITAAGATVNIVFGFLAMILLTAIINIQGNTIGRQYAKEDFKPEAPITFEDVNSNEKLQLGDTIVKVNGKKVAIFDEIYYEVMRFGNEPVDMTVIRDGKEILVEDVVFPKLTEQDQEFGYANFMTYSVDKNFFNTIGLAVRKTGLTLRMCWESIADLITGRYSLSAVSGPVGISGAIGDAVTQGIDSLLNIVVIISINLGFMNLLPIPALDGGRLLTILAEMVTRKKMPAKVEAAINGAGLMILLLLSVVIMIKDVIQLF